MQLQKVRQGSSNETRIKACQQKVPLLSGGFLQAARAAQTCQRQLQEAVSGLEVLGHLTMSRRDVVLLFSGGGPARARSGETTGTRGTS